MVKGYENILFSCFHEIPYSGTRDRSVSIWARLYDGRPGNLGSATDREDFSPPHNAHTGSGADIGVYPRILGAISSPE
jgi:hypothetical protein